MNAPVQPPRLIAWEVTRRCTMKCRHCRGASLDVPYEDELTTGECETFLDRLAAWAKPIVIFTGGEALLRPDIFALVERAHGHGMRCALATCGGPVDDATARRIQEAGVARVSISVDGSTAASHDDFRGVDGAFEAALSAARRLTAAGVEFQVNTTVTRHNREELPEILALARTLGAAAFDAFLLVPTGRGRELAAAELSPEEYEETLGWLADQRDGAGLAVRVTCAPHFHRILRQRGASRRGPHGLDAETRGCLGGKSFVFVSHRGIVQICGFLDVPAGDLREADLDLRTLWEGSPFLAEIRNVNGYGGRCGVCGYRKLCGGCRARAYALTGDYLAEEPFCTYDPTAGGEEP